MNIFAVVCHESNALTEYGVFLAQANAELRRSEAGIPQDALVMELPVHGRMEHAGIVYASSVHVASSNVHFFSGFYGNLDLAVSKAGKEGLVVRREIDGWWSGALSSNHQ